MINIIDGSTPIAGGGLWSKNSDDIYYNDGNVGVGTDSPGLHWTKAVSINTDTNAGFELNKSDVKYGSLGLQGDGRVQTVNFTDNPVTINTNGSSG